MTAFTVASSKRFSISGIWPCASNSSDVTFGCCSCSPTVVMPARCSACDLPVALAAGSSVGCLPRSVTSALLSRGAAEGEIRALAALVIPPLSCASLLARIRRASGVPSRAFCRLLPTNTTSQSMRPVSSSLVYSLYRPCRPSAIASIRRLLNRAGVMWRSLVALSRLLTRALLWEPSAGATCRAL